ncbi:Steroid receptor RNA activator 1 [Oopsacas minuta]|uniref:Steroid receptor RNA activator 1 n=1 Tax=Oopsacas minuta TaxID=111878 RepID=A0AAV7JBX7_9METZ|nr:Steroid receptor RNA activator 1 [Oopsacas minuta]
MSEDSSVTTSGWNDPPSFLYTTNMHDPISIHSIPKPILLPWTQNDTQQLQPQQQQLQSQNYIPFNTVKTQSTKSSFIDIFRKSLTDNNHKFKPTILSNLTSKLDMLESSLQENILPSPVVQVLNELAEYILNKDFNKAYQLHIFLLADFPTHVNGWILAIKKIILAYQDSRVVM